MGIDTDYVVAQQSEAAAVLAEPSPARHWQGFESKSIDPVKLATLKFILDGVPLKTEPVVAYTSDMKILKEVEGSRWVFLVPDDLVTRLAGLSDFQLPSIAKQWHQTEEFRLDGWREADVLDVLRDLRDLAHAAKASKKSVLLLVSL